MGPQQHRHIIVGRTIRGRMMPLAMALAVLMSGVAGVIAPFDASAATYSCGPANDASRHCYGIAWWDGYTTGAQSWILMTNINYNSGDNVISNEMWLLDTGSANCSSVCFIETGYYARYGQVVYFIGEMKSGQSLVVTPLGNVPSGDYGYRTGFYIWNNYGSYSVVINGAYFDWSGYSTPNNQIFNAIEIGEELSGITGAYSPNTHWKYNQWRDTSSQWQYQTRTYNYYDVDNPPIHASWLSIPNGSNYGGDWQANCCY